MQERFMRRTQKNNRIFTKNSVHAALNRNVGEEKSKKNFKKTKNIYFNRRGLATKAPRVAIRISSDKG